MVGEAVRASRRNRESRDVRRGRGRPCALIERERERERGGEGREAASTGI
jgi:hypothetical protein